MTEQAYSTNIDSLDRLHSSADYHGMTPEEYEEREYLRVCGPEEWDEEEERRNEKEAKEKGFNFYGWSAQDFKDFYTD